MCEIIDSTFFEKNLIRCNTYWDAAASNKHATHRYSKHINKAAYSNHSSWLRKLWFTASTDKTRLLLNPLICLLCTCHNHLIRFSSILSKTSKLPTRYSRNILSSMKALSIQTCFSNMVPITRFSNMILDELIVLSEVRRTFTTQ